MAFMTKTHENDENNAVNTEKENRVLKELLAEALETIKKLERRLQKYENPNDGYNKAWTVVTKIVFLITKADKPLRSSEIISLLKQREPSIVKKQDSIEKYLSAFLNTAMKHERLIPFKLKGVRGNFYCLPEWMNEDRELKPEMRGKIY
jgi:sugar-specific transcriptional regulator TrmB